MSIALWNGTDIFGCDTGGDRLGLQDLAARPNDLGVTRQRRQHPATDPAAPRPRPHRLPWWLVILVLASGCGGADDTTSSPAMSRTEARLRGERPPSKATIEELDVGLNR
jgi:hypothetical protein